MFWEIGKWSRDRARRRRTWKPYFAWHPVNLIGGDGTKLSAWWEWVEEKEIQIYGGMDDGWPWHAFYRLVGDDTDVRLDPHNEWRAEIFKPNKEEEQPVQKESV